MKLQSSQSNCLSSSSCLSLWKKEEELNFWKIICNPNKINLMQLVSTHGPREVLCGWKFNHNEVNSVKYHKTWHYVWSTLLLRVKGICSNIPFPKMTHHSSCQFIQWSILFLCDAYKLKRILFPSDDILIGISQQAWTQVMMLWKCTYTDIILGIVSP